MHPTLFDLREEGLNRTKEAMVHFRSRLMVATRTREGLEEARTDYEVARFHYELYKNWIRTGEIPDSERFYLGIAAALDEFSHGEFTKTIRNNNDKD